LKTTGQISILFFAVIQLSSTGGIKLDTSDLDF